LKKHTVQETLQSDCQLAVAVLVIRAKQIGSKWQFDK